MIAIGFILSVFYQENHQEERPPQNEKTDTDEFRVTGTDTSTSATANGEGKGTEPLAHLIESESCTYGQKDKVG